MGLRAVPSLRYMQATPQFTEHYYESDEEGVMGELKRKPWHGDALHPGPDGRDDLPGQEEAVVAVPQGSQHPARARLSRNPLRLSH